MTDLPQDFGVSIVQVNGHAHVRVAGEIDLATAPELRQRLEAVIAAGICNLDLDLSDVTFLDSRGLVALLEVRRDLHERRLRLRVLNPSQPVLRLFTLRGVLDLMVDGQRSSAGSRRTPDD